MLKSLFKPKPLLISLLLTIATYLLTYMLSSQEVLFDFKNLCFIFIFSLIWISIYNNVSAKLPLSALYIISVCLGLTTPFLAYFSEPMFLQRLMKDFLFWYSFPLIPITLSFCFTNPANHKPVLNSLSIIVLTFASIPLLIIVGYYLVFSTQISVDSLLAVFQSNKQESLEFIATYTKPSVIALLFTSIVLIVSIDKFIYNNQFFCKRLTPPKLQP